MRKLLVLLASTSFSLLQASNNISETTAEFSGEGLRKTAPEFIVINLGVNSDCQNTPKDAQAATDVVTTKINSFLQSIKDPNDKYFDVLVDGGFSKPYSRWQIFYTQKQQQQENREVCRTTFQKSTFISIKIGMRNDFHEVFSKIQDFVLKQFAQEALSDHESAGPRTYVSIGTPQPEITRARRISLERDALDLAVRDAKSNFMASIKSCEPHRWKILSIKEGNTSYAPVRNARFYASNMPAEISTPAPVRFDRIEVSKNVTVSFKFEGALCFAKE